MGDTELDSTADLKTIRMLYRDGLVSKDAHIAATRILRPGYGWFLWVRQMLLSYGSALVLAGIIYFFAYNWAEMGKFLKFGLIEVGIVACIVGSYVRGRERASSKILLLGGSVLVGVLLAVYGQIYQTGADAYELFIGWSVLIFGWVIISEFAALWLLWLTLLNSGAILYWEQVGEHVRFVEFGYFCLMVAALNGAALVLREVGAIQKLEWLSGRWLRGLLLVALLITLSLPAIELIVNFDKSGVDSALGTLVWLFVAAAAYAWYRFKLRDMVPLALIVMNVCVILLTLIGQLLFHDTLFGDGGLHLLFALIILAVVSGAAFWLRETAATVTTEIKEIPHEQ